MRPVLEKRRVRKDLSGTVQKNLRVIEYMGSSVSGKRARRPYWRCECLVCGLEVVTTFAIKHKIDRCRHCTNGTGRDHYAWKGCGDLPKDLYTSYRHSAADRHLSFDVTIEQMWNLFEAQGKLCALTGWPIVFHRTYRSKATRTASLDRIDSTKGYEIKNLQWVHKDINMLKKNMDDRAFIRLCVAVGKHQKKANDDDDQKRLEYRQTEQ